LGVKGFAPDHPHPHPPLRREQTPSVAPSHVKTRRTRERPGRSRSRRDEGSRTPLTPPCKSTAPPATTRNVQVTVTPSMAWLSATAVADGNSVPSRVPSGLLWTLSLGPHTLPASALVLQHVLTPSTPGQRQQPTPPGPPGPCRPPEATLGLLSWPPPIGNWRLHPAAHGDKVAYCTYGQFGN
jgi:hypothetical protein